MSGPPRPAATVMLVREQANGLAVYMTRRSARSRFVPDAWVFPGGTVDPADRSPERLARVTGAVSPPGPEFSAAALRELFEEAGVLLACDAGGAPVALNEAQLAALRAGELEKRDFTALLESQNLWLDARALVHYSNWITPESEPYRFDAHFFIAAAPAGQIASADAVEVHDGRWVVPLEALAHAESGAMPMIFPTRAHLGRLAEFSRIDDLLANARARTVVAVMPVQRDDGEFAFAAGSEEW